MFITSNDKTTRYGAIVITGAMGTLGSRTLADVLASDPRTVICLIEAPSDEEAAKRGRAAFVIANGRSLTDEEADRIRWEPTTPQAERCGLSKPAWADLTEQVADIFDADPAHAAAVQELETSATRRGSFGRRHTLVGARLAA